MQPENWPLSRPPDLGMPDSSSPANVIRRLEKGREKEREMLHNVEREIDLLSRPRAMLGWEVAFFADSKSSVFWSL